jgi:predicted DNA-binding transcriptional regulator AlpA
MTQAKPNASKIRFDDLSDDAFIQIRKLLELEVVPFSGTTIWRKCRNNEFPKIYKLSKGISAFRVGDIRGYLLEISSPKADRTHRSSKSC